ncbi:MAG: Flp family type IVb pilin [Pseudorhodoplanes sp.]
MKTLESFAAPFRRFLRDEKGATAIEYAMIAAGIGVAVAATVMALGTRVGSMFESVKSVWPS